MNDVKKQKSLGFTLLEVLAALTILAVALTAVMVTSIELSGNISYLRDKTVGLWVGNNIIAEVRLGLLVPPYAPKEQRGTTAMYGQQWHWAVSLEKTPDKDTSKINVGVGTKPNSAVLRLIAYVREPLP